MGLFLLVESVNGGSHCFSTEGVFSKTQAQNQQGVVTTALNEEKTLRGGDMNAVYIPSNEKHSEATDSRQIEKEFPIEGEIHCPLADLINPDGKAFPTKLSKLWEMPDRINADMRGELDTLHLWSIAAKEPLLNGIVGRDSNENSFNVQ